MKNPTFQKTNATLEQIIELTNAIQATEDSVSRAMSLAQEMGLDHLFNELEKTHIQIGDTSVRFHDTNQTLNDIIPPPQQG